ncbi:olfactory receptor 12D2-like [Spea bombifrons]|uniref:olfactory receptor 12D2-like n=1 Tax=Spea bombifrons TaxID=233779 RepID=UPI00234BADA3|nr:olfactory receptor 12D2-like [Spea bombifrons]
MDNSFIQQLNAQCTSICITNSKNQTFITEFALLGLTDLVELQLPAFAAILVFFLVNITGNFFILSFTISDPSLHTPMYFFLGNLSFFDISFSCVVVPKMLVDFLSQKKTISFGGCISQMHFFHFLGSSEITLLTIMSYDRYLAIGNPLHYTIIMNAKVCRLLVVGCWVIGFLHSLLHTLLTARLPFCGPNLVKHFFCDIKPVVTLACTDISLNINLLNMITGFLATVCLLLTIFPYVLIGRLLYNIKVTEGRQRALSTCSAHFTVVLLYYGTAVFTYLRPSTQGSLNQDRLAAVLFTVVTPALNPIVYTLRNKDMKRAMKRAGKRCSLCARV